MCSSRSVRSTVTYLAITAVLGLGTLGCSIIAQRPQAEEASPCGHNHVADFSDGLKPLKIIVRCDEFKVDVLDPNKVEYLSYLNKLDLWFRNMGRDLPTKFYQYQAWVINDSPDDVEMIFLSFPATRMFVQGGRRLSLPTPGCGKVVFSFITPAAPKTERVEIVLGRSNPDWDTPDGLSKVRLAYGTLDLKMPKTNEYDYDLGLSEVPLEDVLDEAEATHPGCKS